MDTLDSVRPWLACLAALAVVGPILISGRRPNVRETWTFLGAGAMLAIVVSMLPTILAGKTIAYTVWQLLPNLAIRFEVDAMGMLFALVASTLWLVTSLYSIGYMRGLKEHAQTRFFAFFAVALFATLGVAFSANLLTLYLFYEILSLSTYPLVTHHQDTEARTGGRTYLTYLLGTSVGLALPAMIVIYSLNGGNLEFSAEGMLGDGLSRNQGIILLLMLVFGFAKAGLMPFHSWLPGAMVAPTPVSALLHAVAVVKVGVFCVIRVLTDVFGYELLEDLDLASIVRWIAAFTILASSLIALSQDSLKRRLAFSTIGQLSYIILGASLLSSYALTGSLMHIAMHAFGKITLFFCAGAIYVATGKKYISEMTGIGRRMPITMGAFFIGSMSVVGLPFTGGFLSKVYLLWGAASGEHYALLTVFLISSFLNAAYFFPIVFNAFFRPPQDPSLRGRIREAPFPAVAAICLTALGSVALFLFPNLVHDLAAAASELAVRAGEVSE